MKRIPGFIHLIFDLVEHTTNLVERTHAGTVNRSIRRFAPIEPVKTPVLGVVAIERRIAKGVYRSIRSVNGMTRRAVGTGVNLAEQRLASSARSELLGLATPLQSTAVGSASWTLDLLQSAVNGFFGDSLNRQQSPLDLGMSVRHHGHALPMTRERFADAFPRAGSKVCVLIHGLTMTEWSWSSSSEAHYGQADVTFGTRLERDLGYTPIYVRYNSGLRIAENGRSLSRLLTEIMEAYPRPIEEVCLIGYSMGGLVARSAAHHGHQHQAPWLARLRRIVCIGTPHHGSPHAKAADLLSGILRRVDAAAPQVIADLLDIRSGGIRDLEHGTIFDRAPVDEDAEQMFAGGPPDPPLIEGVGYSFVAATVTRDPEHPFGRLLGDLLVTVPSATGDLPKSVHRIPFQNGQVLHGLHHFHLTSHPKVYEAIRDQLATAVDAEGG